MFALLREPHRLRILRLLLQEELCVCELVDALQMPQYKVSRHLGQLRKVGLVEATRSGRWMHYRISRQAAATPFCHDLLKLLDVHTRDLAEAKRDDVRLARQLASGRADRYMCT